MSPRLISFSLYGQDPLYIEGAIENARLCDRFYPGWRCRFHIDDTVPGECVEALLQLGAEIVAGHVQKGPHYGKYWRYLAAAGSHLDYVIFRDADSRLNSRESAAVGEWLASGASLHVMRDNAAHHRKPALGGMWGCRGGAVPDIDALINTKGSFDKHGQSDEFVGTLIFPRFAGDRCVHDDHAFTPDSRPFPRHAPLEGTSFVGEIVPPIGREPCDWSDVWLRAGHPEAQLVVAQRRVAELTVERDRLAEEFASRCLREVEQGTRPRRLQGARSLAWPLLRDGARCNPRRK